MISGTTLSLEAEAADPVFLCFGLAKLGKCCSFTISGVDPRLLLLLEEFSVCSGRVKAAVFLRSMWKICFLNSCIDLCSFSACLGEQGLWNPLLLDFVWVPLAILTIVTVYAPESVKTCL